MKLGYWIVKCMATKLLENVGVSINITSFGENFPYRKVTDLEK